MISFLNQGLVTRTRLMIVEMFDSNAGSRAAAWWKIETRRLGCCRNLFALA
ncbi:hypothetical protein HETIRDRAFT_322449 [Heterobasidion irregulare TC 32-1]|uniref:Uncharacterized protein n=1 Tax=Heterobasidion irregulare (strain TC 32-1) TaxID=747525 RepID=W4K2D9_HETIT|nr:uncharacterized protein HETIRDRAFT_322449 [Heterobasidion irregulare TC 32-1]ETW79988.1 hypothetical protein HETIRDRAFT_322449 [Heterobasidion irregulare TC 32-1]